MSCSCVAIICQQALNSVSHALYWSYIFICDDDTVAISDPQVVCNAANSERKHWNGCPHGLDVGDAECFMLQIRVHCECDMFPQKTDDVLVLHPPVEEYIRGGITLVRAWGQTTTPGWTSCDTETKSAGQLHEWPQELSVSEHNEARMLRLAHPGPAQMRCYANEDAWALDGTETPDEGHDAATLRDPLDLR